ncbi:NUDIX hydrolase [Neobacillus sp. NPDC093182]|uniref:NUDIX hydrolase n=1 Tax=Neobacillus sp. NPDC093182 TaxID=3364297 RepID=UPI003806D797
MCDPLKRHRLVVSVSVIKDNEVLLIKENKPTAFNKWNFPSGRVEHGEDNLNAASREVKEETGLDVELLNTTGIYYFVSDLNDQVILFHFIGEIVGGTLRIDNEEIIDSKWVKLNEINNFTNLEFRNSMVLKQIFDALLSQKSYPTTIFKEQLNNR